MTTSAPSSPDGDDAYPTELVVDDEPANQELASIFLEDKSYTVRQACDSVIAFAEAYITLFEQIARDGVERIGPNPVTEFDSISVSPGIGDGFSLAELVCVTGEVQLGEASSVGKQSSICADEGTPIVIGRRSRIRSRVTFHALEHTSV